MEVDQTPAPAPQSSQTGFHKQSLLSRFLSLIQQGRLLILPAVQQPREGRGDPMVLTLGLFLLPHVLRLIRNRL